MADPIGAGLGAGTGASASVIQDSMEVIMEVITVADIIRVPITDILIIPILITPILQVIARTKPEEGITEALRDLPEQLTADRLILLIEAEVRQATPNREETPTRYRDPVSMPILEAALRPRASATLAI